MAAVLLRLCDEDRERFGGPEWVRFDQGELDRQPLSVLHDLELGLNISLAFLFQVDRPTRMQRWTAARVWIGRKLAGIETADFGEFSTIQTLKVLEVPEDPEAGDADPPSSSPSSEEEASGTVSV